MIRVKTTSLLLALAALCTRPLAAQEAMVESLRVFPAEISLATSHDRQLVVVQAVFSDGITRDVTSQAVLTLANPALLRREGNTFRPAADGQTELKVEFAGKSQVIPVKVEKAAQPRAATVPGDPPWRLAAPRHDVLAAGKFALPHSSGGTAS